MEAVTYKPENVTFQHYKDMAQEVIRWATEDEDWEWLQGPCAQWWFKFFDGTPDRAYEIATNESYYPRLVCECGSHWDA